VLQFVDEATPASAPPAGVFFKPEPLDYQGLLATLLEQSSESLRCIAAYHVGELKLVPLRDKLESLELRETGFFLARVVERTLRLLGGVEKGVAHAR
jgi:hypothetical protein